MDAEFLRDSKTPAQAEFIAYLDEEDLRELICTGQLFEERDEDVLEIYLDKKRQDNIQPYDDVLEALGQAVYFIQEIKYADGREKALEDVNTAKIERTYQYYSDIQKQYNGNN